MLHICNIYFRIFATLLLTIATRWGILNTDSRINETARKEDKHVPRRCQ
nr:MAG TPA: hypothetical protein [Caudoviricetes sp.]